MIRRLYPIAILSLLMTIGVGIRTQHAQPNPPGARPKAGARAEPAEVKTLPSQRPANLQGFGTTGQIPKFGGGDYLVNSLIFESSAGKIGIGTQAPGSTLSVNGEIETLSGGVKFPDGTMQTTAGVSPRESVASLSGLKGAVTLSGGSNIAITPAGNTLTVSAPNMLTAVAHDATLTGDGSPTSPLSAMSTAAQGQPFVAAGPGAAFDQNFSQSLLTTVPAGKRLVIEQVTALCILNQGDRPHIITLKIDAFDHYLLSSFTGTTGFDFYVVSQNVKFHAPSGANVYLRVNRTGTGSGGSNSCSGNLSGYLVDQP